MELTAAEKQAGREFRESAALDLMLVNEHDPPTYEVPYFLAIYRHLCAARNNRSTSLELKERYIFSPPFPGEQVPAGRFGYIYREGQCRACGQTARSSVGRLVDGWERPPISGRVARS